MKYPTTILKGDNSVGKCISIATSSKNAIQDTGARMFHIGRNTRSQIISKSIANSGGNATYRGLIDISKNSTNSYSEVICDSLILDDKSKSDTFPTEINRCDSSFVKHEAKITDLDKETLFYINSKGVDEKQAKHLVVLGFIEPFSRNLPLEYSVELNRLLKTVLE
jgi:Fe-S cluster assembly protein SufB